MAFHKKYPEEIEAEALAAKKAEEEAKAKEAVEAKKAEEEAKAKEAAEKEKEKVALQAKATKKKKRYFISKFRMFHPYQNKYLGDTPVPLELDGWLESQIAAGIVTETEE